MKSAQWGADATIAMEPDPQNHKHLLTHLMINNLSSKVETHHLAASSQACTLTFLVSEAISCGNRGGAQVVSDLNDNSVSVKGVKLDDVAPFTGRNIIVKLDVEGHELHALRGMQRLCRENVIFAQIEIWKENQQSVCEYAQSIGLRLVHSIADDFFFSNRADLVWLENALGSQGSVPDCERIKTDASL
jgi:FkbM family methyltransferase